jgi:hypothetical protein
MKTVSTLKQTGIFWRPESPRQKLPGILSVSESGKPVLELIGIYGGNTEESMFGSNELGRIVGEVEDGDPITLEGCRYSKRSQSLSGLSKSIVIANYLLKGVLFEDGEPIRFSRTDFFVQGLDEWLGISGFRYEKRTDPQELTIHFALPTEILYELPGDISLGFSFGYAFK